MNTIKHCGPENSCGKYVYSPLELQTLKGQIDIVIICYLINKCSWITQGRGKNCVLSHVLGGENIIIYILVVYREFI